MIRQRHRAAVFAVMVTQLIGARAWAADSVVEPNTRGKLLFTLQCRACHSTHAGEPHKVGPNLNGVLGRAAGSASGFNYSAALKNSGITWNAQTLERWLQKPSADVPGTAMAFEGIASGTDRAAVIAFLIADTAVAAQP